MHSVAVLAWNEATRPSLTGGTFLPCVGMDDRVTVRRGSGGITWLRLELWLVSIYNYPVAFSHKYLLPQAY